MKTLSILLFINILLSTACSPKAASEPQAKSLKVHVEVEIQADDGTRERKEFWVHDASNFENVIGEEAKNGKLRVCISMRSDDIIINKELRGRIESGKIEGLIEEFIILAGSARRLAEWNYSQGVKEGMQTGYYPESGDVQFQGEMRNGHRSGNWTMYYPGGGKAAILEYANGSLDGRSTIYSPRGTEIASGIYKNGERIRGTFIEDVDAFVLSVFKSTPTENEPTGQP